MKDTHATKETLRKEINFLRYEVITSILSLIANICISILLIRNGQFINTIPYLLIFIILFILMVIVLIKNIKEYEITKAKLYLFKN